MSCKLTLHLQRIRRVDLSELAEKIKRYGLYNLFTIVENNNRAPEHYESFLHQPLSCKWVSHLGVLCLSHFALGQWDVIKTKVLIFFLPFSVLLPRLTAPGSSNRLIIKDLCDSVSQLISVRPFRRVKDSIHVKIVKLFQTLWYFRILLSTNFADALGTFSLFCSSLKSSKWGWSVRNFLRDLLSAIFVICLELIARQGTLHRREGW